MVPNHTRRGVAMNGKELLERGLRLGIPLWRIEDEFDWQENQGRRCTENSVNVAVAMAGAPFK